MYIPFNPADQRVEMHPQTADLFIGMFKGYRKKVENSSIMTKIGACSSGGTACSN